MFIDDWHFPNELLPDSISRVWFVVGDELNVGLFKNTFIKADGISIKPDVVDKWMYVSPNPAEGWPSDGQAVAIESNKYPCIVKGVYHDADDIEFVGPSFELDTSYDFKEEVEPFINWEEDVMEWFELPEY